MNQEYPDVRFPGWEVVRKLGQGSFGGVYEIQRTLPDGRVERSALKKLSVPRDREEIEEMLYDPELFHEMTGELLYAY